MDDDQNQNPQSQRTPRSERQRREGGFVRTTRNILLAEGVIHRLVKKIAAAVIVRLVAYLMANPVRSLLSDSFGLGLGLDFEVVKRYPMGEREVIP